MLCTEQGAATDHRIDTVSGAPTLQNLFFKKDPFSFYIIIDSVIELGKLHKKKKTEIYNIIYTGNEKVISYNPNLGHINAVDVQFSASSIHRGCIIADSCHSISLMHSHRSIHVRENSSLNMQYMDQREETTPQQLGLFIKYISTNMEGRHWCHVLIRLYH